ncbi:MAG: minichromosome maintenance protein MCM, partial [Candidatus Diapherotrites archaeon]|nr:minichromosome maintenance protein MCM [Candidatus Diapherotrites archaeon]
MATNIEKTKALSEENPYVEKFREFFGSVYKKEIERLAESYPQKRSLEVDFKKLENYDFELADELLDKPDYMLEAAELAIAKMDIPTLTAEEFVPHVRFYNLPKDKTFMIKEIGSEHLGRLICVEGVVRQLTEVMPKLKLATWRCRRCGNSYTIAQETQQAKKPAFCEECRGRDFELIESESEFVNYQKIQIQEPLEKLHGSEQATYLDVHVSDDLVNRLAPGDKTKFVGILRLYPGQGRKTLFGRYLE